jgi:hypothetical protein
MYNRSPTLFTDNLFSENLQILPFPFNNISFEKIIIKCNTECLVYLVPHILLPKQDSCKTNTIAIGPWT